MILEKLFGKKSQANEHSYDITLTHSEKNENVYTEYPSNRIISSRYTIFSFLPKSFIEQFRKISNFWFIFTMVFFIFADSTLNVYNIIIPVVIVFAISMIKDAFDDIKRHRRDKILNEKRFKLVTVEPNGKCVLSSIKAREIFVGRIIRVDCDQEFPADLIPIYTTNKNATVSVITANLDGETNIKKINTVDTQFQILAKAFSTSGTYEVPQEYRNLSFHIEYNPPDKDLTLFHGSIKDSLGRSIPLSSENLLLRGSRLVKTDWILGLCAYSGINSKLSLNSKPPSRKYSVSEKQINTNILMLIIILFILSIILKIIESNRYIPFFKEISYFSGLSTTRFSYVSRFLITLILYAYLIPISIIISYELAQLWTVFLINNDLKLYDENTNIQSIANSSSLADQLGQVEFLFSDKTGTITQNIMVFRAFALAHRDESYFFCDNNLVPINIHGEEINLEVLDDYLKSASVDTTMNNLSKDTEIRFLFICIALCNTVENNMKTDEGGQTTMNYQSASPDEEALIKAAYKAGIVYHGTKDQMEDFMRRNGKEPRSNDDDEEIAFESTKTRYITISNKLFPKNYEPVEELLESNYYIIDEIIEFNSDRKKMSVIVRFPNGSKFVISKGAETSMTDPRACSGSTDLDKNSILTKVTDFSLIGLRTLVYSVKEIKTDSEYTSLINDIRMARAHLGENREQVLQEAYDKAENNMALLGVTGVEDKLQDGIKECLVSMREAGIQIWVLTGDKEETAISVSQAAGHIPIKSSLMKITNCTSINETLRRIDCHLEGLKIRQETRKKFVDTLRDIPLKLRNAYKKQKQQLYSFSAQSNQRDPRDRIRRKHKKFAGAAGEAVALVIDGKSLKFALLPMLQQKFLRLCMNSSTVLCCRVSPLQKANVVEMVSKGISKLTHSRKPPVTAAIGDGGNDVSMILQADIGIGIFGKEGLHAARSSDYAIPKFAMLRRLLFVHGTWTYQRISYMMLFFYLKCVCFITPNLIFEYYSGYSDQTLYSSDYYTLFNLTFTSVPILIYAAFDRYLPAKSLMRYPRLYRCLTRNPNLSLKVIYSWMFIGFIYGFCCYFSAFLVYFGIDLGSAAFLPPEDPSRLQKDFDMSAFGNTVYVYIWNSVMMRNLVMFHGLNWLVVAIFALNVGVNVGIIFIVDLREGLGIYRYVNTIIPESPAFWLGQLISIVLTLGIDLLWRFLIDFYWKTEYKYAESIALMAEERNRRASENFKNSIRRKSHIKHPRRQSVISIYAKEAMH